MQRTPPRQAIPPAAGDGSPPRPATATAADRRYDSFLVRVWREPAGRRLLRAEVAHVQTGAVSRRVGVAPEWILGCLQRCLEGASAEGGEGQDETAPREDSGG